jgi:hypothetical protein
VANIRVDCSSRRLASIATPAWTFRPGKQLREPVSLRRPSWYVPDCVDGFPADAVLVLRLLGPDGRRIERRGTRLSYPAVSFTTNMPLGRWRMRITAAGTHFPAASASLLVARPNGPTLLQVSEHSPSGKAGTVLEFAGFKPNSEVNVFLYGPDKTRPLPVAVIDKNGESTYSIELKSSYPAGSYYVWLNPRCAPDDDDGYGAACAQFEK